MVAPRDSCPVATPGTIAQIYVQIFFLPYVRVARQEGKVRYSKVLYTLSSVVERAPPTTEQPIQEWSVGLGMRSSLPVDGALPDGARVRSTRTMPETDAHGRLPPARPTERLCSVSRVRAPRRCWHQRDRPAHGLGELESSSIDNVRAQDRIFSRSHPRQSQRACRSNHVAAQVCRLRPWSHTALPHSHLRRWSPSPTRHRGGNRGSGVRHTSPSTPHGCAGALDAKADLSPLATSP